MTAPVFDGFNFVGFGGSPCEHRTVGAHRAWCLQCTMWCYPDDPCYRCLNALWDERQASS